MKKKLLEEDNKYLFQSIAKEKSFNKIINIKILYKIAATILLIIGLSIINISRISKEESYLTEEGTQKEITLPDNSTIRINQFSKIKLARPINTAKYIGIVGEIFVRRDHFSLMGIPEKGM